MRFVKSIFMVALALSLSASLALAELTASQKAVKEYVKEKAKYTGTLDLFDKEINKVRNFKLLKFKDGKQGAVVADFRDNATGDVLELKFIADGEEFSVEIGAMQKKAKVMMEDKDKKFTKEEVKTAINEYISKMTQFSDTYDLFDPAKEEMLHLELVDIEDELRQFGILYIMTANFKNVDTGKTVKVDMTFENSAGKLKSKKVKIK